MACLIHLTSDSNRTQFIGSSGGRVDCLLKGEKKYFEFLPGRSGRYLAMHGVVDMWKLYSRFDFGNNLLLNYKPVPRCRVKILRSFDRITIRYPEEDKCKEYLYMTTEDMEQLPVEALPADIRFYMEGERIKKCDAPRKSTFLEELLYLQRDNARHHSGKRAADGSPADEPEPKRAYLMAEDGEEIELLVKRKKRTADGSPADEPEPKRAYLMAEDEEETDTTGDVYLKETVFGQYRLRSESLDPDQLRYTWTEPTVVRDCEPRTEEVKRPVVGKGPFAMPWRDVYFKKKKYKFVPSHDAELVHAGMSLNDAEKQSAHFSMSTMGAFKRGAIPSTRPQVARSEHGDGPDLTPEEEYQFGLRIQRAVLRGRRIPLRPGSLLKTRAKGLNVSFKC